MFGNFVVVIMFVVAEVMRYCLFVFLILPSAHIQLFCRVYTLLCNIKHCVSANRPYSCCTLMYSFFISKSLCLEMTYYKWVTNLVLLRLFIGICITCYSFDFCDLSCVGDVASSIIEKNLVYGMYCISVSYPSHAISRYLCVRPTHNSQQINFSNHSVW